MYIKKIQLNKLRRKNVKKKPHEKADVNGHKKERILIRERDVPSETH